MEYNLAALRKRIAIDRLDDEDFEPDLIDRFINDAQRDIFNKFELPFQEKIFSGQLPVGVNMFQLPSDVASVQSRVVTSPDGSQRTIDNGYMRFKDFNRNFPTPANNQPGPINYWTLYANSMITSCPTDQEYTLDLYYLRKPKTLVEGTDVPEIPEEFAELLIMGALKRIYFREGDEDELTWANAEYTRLETLLTNRYGSRQKNGPTIIATRYVGRR